jgi:hypothetical protein
LVALLLAPLESELGENGAGRWARSFSEIGMAWLIGDAALSLAVPPLESALLALLFATAYRGLLSVASRPGLGFVILNAAQVALILILAVRGAFINATIVTLGFGAIILWETLVRSGRVEPRLFLGRVQWYVLLAMVTAALGISP